MRVGQWIIAGMLWGWATVCVAGIANTTGWHALSGTDPESVCQYPSGTNSGNTGCAALTSTWNGALFDTANNRLVFGWGGGHNDYYGTEIIALSLGTTSAITDSQSIARIRESNSSPQSYGSAGLLSGNTEPRARHTYNNLAYLPDQAKYLLTGGGTSAVGDITHESILWAPGTNTYTVLGSTLNYCDVNWYSHALAYDGERHIVWAFDGCEVHIFTAATSTWSTPTQSGTWGTSALQEAQGVYDPVRRRYYLIGGGVIRYVSTKSTDTPTETTPSTSGCSGAFTGAVGADYDSAQDRIAIWNGGNTTYLLDPATHACTTAVHTGGPSTETNGTWGRFRYSAKDNLFVVCATAAADCYALRLTVQDADSDFGRRCHAPGVTVCESFDTIGDYTHGVKYFNGDGSFDGADLDTSVKTSGTGALRFNLPSGRATSNISGDFRVCIRTPCTIDGNDTTAPGFGFPSDFWMSWRIRASATMVSNLVDYWRAGASRTGWKSVNLHNGAQGSCGSLEITKTIDTSFPDGTTQIWYKECSPGITTDSSGNGDGGSPYFQQGNLTQSTATNGFWCDWNDNENYGTGTGQGCFGWQWTAEWLTFIEHYQIGNNGAATSQLDAWIYREGSTTALQILNVNNETLTYGSNPVGQRTYNQVSFTPYMTGLSVSAPSDANLWFDEFIVSTEQILPPGDFGGSDTTPPAVPSGVYVTQRRP